MFAGAQDVYPDAGKAAMILGLLKVMGLRLMGGFFDAWLLPFVRLTLVAVGIAVAAILYKGFWPTGDGVQKAIVEASQERDDIEAAHADEEKRDDAWLKKQVKIMKKVRDAEIAEANNRVLWGDDDGWLRAKRDTARR